MQTLNEARDTAQRQLDAESKKKSNKVCPAVKHMFYQSVTNHMEMLPLKLFWYTQAHC